MDDSGVDSTTILWEWCRQGWRYRKLNERLTPEQRKQYGERVQYEMNLIVDKDFVDYFLVLSDVVRTAKDRGIAVGPARGSAAASLVCYLIRMTEVDPLQYPLMLFERFIDPNRHDLPDVDLDFEDDRRDEVRQIMIEKYGVDRVGNIGTFTRYRGKNAIDDVARVYSLPKFEIDSAKEFIVERSGGDSRFDASILDTVEMFPQVKDTFDKYPELYKSIELEGNYKSFGVHAAGLVIGASRLTDYVATYGKKGVGRNKNDVQVLSVDKYDGEHLGLMKLDALGLSTMGMISRATKMLGMSLNDLYDIPMTDQPTLSAFQRADVTGIFQFEGRTMKLVCEELKPETFMDLAAVNALARPGPLHSGSTGEYIAIRHGRQKRHDLHPIVARICDATEGQIIYQEQILQITRDVGKFPWTHASAIRKIISSKKGESAFNAMWGDFRDGAAQSNIDEHTAAEIWKRMATAGTYAFNIAHCVSYSMLGFWAMWLKVHHPKEFYAAALQKQDDTDRQRVLMRDAQDARFGRSIQILPPHPVHSAATWIPDPVENAVRAGYHQLPRVGEATAHKIVEHAATTPLEAWSDLKEIKGIGPKMVESVEAFCAHPDPFRVFQLRDELNAIRRDLANPPKGSGLAMLPRPNTTADQIPYEDKRSTHVVLGRLKNRNLQDLFENYRSRTGEELDPKTVDKPELKDSMTLYLEDETGLMTVKVSRHLYPEVKEMLWGTKLGVDYLLVDAFKYAFLGKTIHARALWPIEA